MTPMDITAWLRGLGLEQYAQSFRENDVDAAVLPELTADDLIGLGVSSIGHRRRLLAAIASAELPQPPTGDARRQPGAAERRQLTVNVQRPRRLDDAGLPARSRRAW
jgi:hypothetical protein